MRKSPKPRVKDFGALLAREEALNALHTAVVNSNANTVKAILAKDTSLGQEQNAKGQTALHVALTSKSSSAAILNTLLQAQCSLELRDNDGYTPLMLCIALHSPHINTLLPWIASEKTWRILPTAKDTRLLTWLRHLSAQKYYNDALRAGVTHFVCQFHPAIVKNSGFWVEHEPSIIGLLCDMPTHAWKYSDALEEDAAWPEDILDLGDEVLDPEDYVSSTREGLRLRQPWDLNYRLRNAMYWQRMEGSGGDIRTYDLMCRSDPVAVREFRRMESYFNVLGGDKMTIVKAMLVHNPNLDDTFVSSLVNLQQKRRDDPETFLRDEWKEEACPHRNLMAEALGQRLDVFQWNENRQIPVIIAASGLPVSGEFGDILRDGVETVEGTGAWYGRGAYYTTCVPYALRNVEEKDKYVLLSVVYPGNSYPLKEQPGTEEQFVDKPMMSGYQSNYALVNYEGQIASQNEILTELVCDELVLAQKHQAVPRYVLVVRDRLKLEKYAKNDEYPLQSKTPYD